jgi:anaerobic selenocysteine-containing dehydrogenase
MKLIVADPRRTDTAEAADLHLPCSPAPTWRCSTACCT